VADGRVCFASPTLPKPDALRWPLLLVFSRHLDDCECLVVHSTLLELLTQQGQDGLGYWLVAGFIYPSFLV
jgi:hypothetical protein